MPAERTARGLIAGTRGSNLARIQTELALDRLRRAHPELPVEVQVIRTSGDRDRVAPLSQIGGKGIFVKELEDALLGARIDLAVHSLKDLPPRLAPGLVLAAVPERADPRDALISRDGTSLSGLPPGARVGTGSARRRALLRRLRPDLEFVELRGNVDTRIRKVKAGAADAAVLAAAGLARLGRLDEAAEIFAVDCLIPSPGQGALGIEVREDDAFTLDAVRAIDDAACRLCAEAERAFLARLGAGCTLPAGAYASIDGATMTIWGVLASADGSRLVQQQLSGRPEQAAVLGDGLAAALSEAAGR